MEPITYSSQVDRVHKQQHPEDQWQAHPQEGDLMGSEMNGFVLAEAVGKVGGMEALQIALKNGSIRKTNVKGLDVPGGKQTTQTHNPTSA